MYEKSVTIDTVEACITNGHSASSISKRKLDEPVAH